MMDKIEELNNIIKNANNIVFFGGAGVSTASRIPDFRSANGLYSHTPEELVSHHFWKSNPKEFYEFYFSKMVYPNAEPNECHKFLSQLEKSGKNVTIVTQNIDGLHQKAGSKNVLELHGTVNKNHCIKCNKFYSLDEIEKTGIPYCECGGIIRPDVVLYEEQLDENTIIKTIKAIQKSDCLIVCGTSLIVYPAASFINYFIGNNLIVINKDSTQTDKNADLVFQDDINDIFKKLKI